MDKELESKLLSMFESYKGYSSNLFAGEEWRELDAFIDGYLSAKKEFKTK